MPASEKELEEQLVEAGNRLGSLPSSVEELLHLLDRFEICLSRVDQSPPESLQNALAPSIKALIADVLLRHADLDVRVAVAACISEITRITAPEAPYDDDQMKEVFKLIVSSFERLYDKSSRSYNKRVSILETVSKVRSCVLMLDLECDDLILEMFNHFFTTVRENHPENVFTSMETIMTLVLDESEEISPVLISSILSPLEKDKEVLPVARKLGEKVLENCASKLQPLLVQVIKAFGKSLDIYSIAVVNICEGRPADELNSINVARGNSVDENVLSKVSEVADEVAGETPSETIHSGEVYVATASSLKAVTSNGTVEKEDDSQIIKDSSDPAEVDGSDKPKTTMNIDQSQLVDEEKTSTVAKSQAKPEKVKKKRGRKPNSLKTPSEPSRAHIHIDKEEKGLDPVEVKANNSASSAHCELAVDASNPSENEKESNARASAPKVSGNQGLDCPSQSPSRTVPNESQSKRVGRGRKKANSISTPSVDSDSMKVVEGTVISEPEAHKETKKNAQLAEEASPTPAKRSNREDGVSNNLDARSADQTVKKDEDADNQLEDKPKRRKGRPPKEKVLLGSPPKDNEKKLVSSPKSLEKLIKDASDMEKSANVNSKRRHTPAKQKAAYLHGDDLVGLRIRVWWPDDQKFYKGVITEFNPVEKKHKVTYDDGDVEVLVLEDERWGVVDEKLLSPKGHVSEAESPNASSEMHKNKKSKPNPESVTKRGRKPNSGSASSSKGKATPSRRGRKRKDEGKLDVKSKDISPEDEQGGKAKDQKDGNGSADNVSKFVDNSEDDDIPLSSVKSKTVTPKTTSKSEGKTSNSGSKSTDKEDVKKNVESDSALESSKGKSASSTNASKSETKSGRKRSRGT